MGMCWSEVEAEVGFWVTLAESAGNLMVRLAEWPSATISHSRRPVSAGTDASTGGSGESDSWAAAHHWGGKFALFSSMTIIKLVLLVAVQICTLVKRHG